MVLVTMPMTNTTSHSPNQRHRIRLSTKIPFPQIMFGRMYEGGFCVEEGREYEIFKQEVIFFNNNIDLLLVVQIVCQFFFSLIH